MPRELAKAQRWMQGAILAEEPVTARQARRRILPSKTLKPEQRIEIYRDMYETRLHQALATDYPATLDFLGEGRFGELVHLYVGSHPSRSYTLNRLGDRLPDFIRKDLAGAPRPGFLHDLARYELAQTVVFDEEETASLTAEEIAAIPEESWPRARLEIIPALRLLALRYPVHRYARAMREGKKRPRILRRPTWLAVYRVRYALGTLELTRQSYRLLSAIASGQPLEDALKGTRATRTTIEKWFQGWTAAGVFGAILPSP